MWKDSGKVTKSVAEQRAESSFPATVPDVLGKPAAGSLSPLDPKVHLEQAMLKLRARLSRSPVLQGLPASSPTAWCPPTCPLSLFRASCTSGSCRRSLSAAERREGGPTKSFSLRLF